MSDRVVRFSEASWQEVEALPEPLRWTVQRAIFHLLDEPVPNSRIPSRRMTRFPEPMNCTCPQTT